MTTTCETITATISVRHRLTATQSWDEAVDALIAAIEPTITRHVEAAHERHSTNAYKRNNWTPQDKVTFSGTYVLNGEDISDSCGGALRKLKTRKSVERFLADGLEETRTLFTDRGSYIAYLDGHWDPEVCAFLDAHFGVTPEAIADELAEREAAQS